jgi:fatty acid desaturase
MFLHAEHHLFPSVPTFRLQELARRLDRAAPAIAERQVI